MAHPRNRDDVSRFLVHLSRDYDSIPAIENLVSILKLRKIEARNPHCLVAPILKKMQFTDMLQRKFNTICLTETPLHQVSKLIQEVPGRRIKLKPFGIVFRRDKLLSRGASPAIYINTDATQLRDYLLEEFRRTFSSTSSYRELKQDNLYPREIIRYYALVNIMGKGYDFSWEREWRFPGDLYFKYTEIVAIIAERREEFFEICENMLSAKQMKDIRRICVIEPNWSYEDMILRMSEALRQASA